MTDLCVDSGNHRVKGFGGNEIDSLDVNFLNIHVRLPLLLLLLPFGPTSRCKWLGQEQCRKVWEILVKYSCSSPVKLSNELKRARRSEWRKQGAVTCN